MASRATTLEAFFWRKNFMSNGKETNEYITQEYAYVSDKGIQT